jgi:hypothetical protein
MRISQNSSAFGDVQFVTGPQAAPRRVHCATVQVPAGRTTLKRRLPLCPDGSFKFDAIVLSLRQRHLPNSILWRCPAFAKHAEAKCRTPCGSDREARPTEQQPIITIRRMAHRNPSRTARNFEATASSGQQDCYRSRRSNHQQLMKSEDRS